MDYEMFGEARGCFRLSAPLAWLRLVAPGRERRPSLVRAI